MSITHVVAKRMPFGSSVKALFPLRKARNRQLDPVESASFRDFPVFGNTILPNARHSKSYSSVPFLVKTVGFARVKVHNKGLHFEYDLELFGP